MKTDVTGKALDEIRVAVLYMGEPSGGEIVGAGVSVAPFLECFQSVLISGILG